MTANPTQPCAHQGCKGLVQDGFCSLCGLAPADALPEPQTAPAPRLPVASPGFATAVLKPNPFPLTPFVYQSDPGTSASTNSTGKTTRSGRTRSRRGTTRSSRKQLGLGLVQLPEIPSIDPAATIMAQPTVPENKRFCAGCETPLKRETGFCPKCGMRYSFIPTLNPGDLVGDQYQVFGCIAYGGLGWIYLAKDNVLNRYVVLKGLLNSNDEAAAAAAVAERQYLAAVKHPNIVGVYNFVQRGPEGYIVMEYIRGKTLRAIRKERGPLPVPEAIAYIHRILLAFGYLHRQRPSLVYCDFKPENVMLEGDDVKLIDLGGVRRVDDPGGDIYGTRGYSAPEAKNGPSIASDLYTVARTLAVLVIEFKGFQSSCEFSLPSPSEEPLFAQYDALYRLLLRATHHDAEQRFQSADELSEQLAGVLREVVSTPESSHPAPSFFFDADTLAAPPAPGVAHPITVAMFPTLKLDPDDPGTPFVISNAHAKPSRHLRSLYEAHIPRFTDSRFPNSAEIRLRLAWLYITMDRAETPETDPFAEAGKYLHEVQLANPFDWRVVWYRGLSAIARRIYSDAVTCFNAVYSELPGELAPKLALAMAYEANKQYSPAIALYTVVVQTDPDFATAALGLARCRLAFNDKAQAVAAFDRVLKSSSLYEYAQLALARTLIIDSPSAPTTFQDLSRASAALQALNSRGIEQYRAAVEILHKTLEQLQTKKIKYSAGVQILGLPLIESSLRTGIEEGLRAIAHLVQDPKERHKLIDMANRIRPHTWF